MRRAVLTVIQDMLEELTLEELAEMEQLLSEAISARMAHPPKRGKDILHQILDGLPRNNHSPKGEKHGS